MMPAQKPGKSKQDYGTPWELIRAVEARWGKLTLDLAAHDDGSNAKADLWFGPSDDYLSQEWTPGTATDEWLCWCNPPFDDIAKWAHKWKADAALGARIIALVPASIGAEWFARYVEDSANVVGLRPRLAFEGGGHQKSCTDSECLGCQTYPKDCMLLLYNVAAPAFSTWRWK